MADNLPAVVHISLRTLEDIESPKRLCPYCKDKTANCPHFQGIDHNFHPTAVFIRSESSRGRRK